MKRVVFIALAWVCTALGFIGVFVPVLPTTPLLLLATFLFARSSPRLYAWIQTTKIYKNYVEAFKQAGGIPLATKARILAVSFGVMGLSAVLVQRPVVWIILGCVAVFLLYLMLIRIPMVKVETVERVRTLEEEPARGIGRLRCANPRPSSQARTAYA